MLLLLGLVISNALLGFLYDPINSPVGRIVSIWGSPGQQQLYNAPVLPGCSSVDGLLASCIFSICITTSLQRTNTLLMLTCSKSVRSDGCHVRRQLFSMPYAFQLQQCG